MYTINNWMYNVPNSGFKSFKFLIFDVHRTYYPLSYYVLDFMFYIY